MIAIRLHTTHTATHFLHHTTLHLAAALHLAFHPLHLALHVSLHGIFLSLLLFWRHAVPILLFLLSSCLTLLLSGIDGSLLLIRGHILESLRTRLCVIYARIHILCKAY